MANSSCRYRQQESIQLTASCGREHCSSSTRSLFRASSAATLPLGDGDDEEAAALAAARRRQEQPADDGGVSEDGAGAGMAMVVDGSIAPDAMLAPPPAPTLEDFLLAQPRLGADDVGQLAF